MLVSFPCRGDDPCRRSSPIFSFNIRLRILALVKFSPGVHLPIRLRFWSMTWPIADLAHLAARRVVLQALSLPLSCRSGLHRRASRLPRARAFLVAQLIDIGVFDRLRASSWWKAPLISTFIGSAVDTVLFFGIAFAPVFAGIDTCLRHGRRFARLSRHQSSASRCRFMHRWRSAIFS